MLWTIGLQIQNFRLGVFLMELLARYLAALWCCLRACECFCPLVHETLIALCLL